MNANDSEQRRNENPPPARRPRKGPLLALIALVIVGGAIQSYRWFTTPRASVDRMLIQTMLRGVAQAYMNYRATNGDWPSFEQLAARGELSRGQVEQFAAVVYKPGAKAETPRLFVVQKQPCRAVAKGEPWGGPGEVTDRDLPPHRYALFDDMRVRGMPEDEFQAQHMPLIEIVVFP